MNRLELRQLAEDRLADAQSLLAAGRWSGAYYLAGYAVECGLKACVLAHIEATGAIFRDRKYAERCWTHNLEELLALANLRPAMDNDTGANLDLLTNWNDTKDWAETSRYTQKTEAEARRLLEAIADVSHGVLPWIRLRW